MKKLLPDTFTLLLVAAVVLANIFPVTGFAATVFSDATNLAIALLFFLHGARLSRDVIMAGFLHWRLQLLVLAATFILFPVLGVGLGALSPWLIPQPLYFGILFLCVLPSTVQSSIAFTSIAGGNVPAAICAASSSNLIGMFLTPLLVGLLFSATGQVGFSWDILLKILLQLFLPFAAGQILEPWIGTWIRAHKGLLGPVDRGSILMVVFLAFSNATVEGLWSRISLHDFAIVAMIDLGLLLVVMVIVNVISKRLGFNLADRITIIFCGSKKSLASGVPMASVIFAGQSIGAIVLPLMLFHQIQLILCAWLARGYALQGKAD